MKKTRHILQAALLALMLKVVLQLDGNAESWCPFGGVESAYAYAKEGVPLSSLGASNFFILGAVLVSVLLIRRAFCGYLCPVGTISEWLGIGMKYLDLPSYRVPAMLDRILSLAKYVVLAAILTATWQLGEVVFRGYCPAYALMSRHGAGITYWAYLISGSIIAGSLLFSMPFCRWFCPLAAVVNPLSRFGLGRIKRDGEACTHCGQCAASCPMAIPVDQLPQVTVSRCTACMNCIEACPKKAQHALLWGPPNRLGRAWHQALAIVILCLCCGAAVAAAYLAPLPSFVKIRGTPPDQVTTVELRIQGLANRDRAKLLAGLLERDDAFKIRGAGADAPGYFKLEVWPDPNAAIVRISYDPKYMNEEAVKLAITEAYFDTKGNPWRLSPFKILDLAPR
jgi:ferredoxin